MNISTLGLLIALLVCSIDLSNSATNGASSSKKVNSGNTVVDDLNGLIR